MHVVAIDRRTMEDLMAWQAVARALVARQGRGTGALVLVAPPGEGTERFLEGHGLDLRGADGLLRSSNPSEEALLVRAVREENRRIVSLLSDEGISAVGFLGGDRGLFGTGERTGWIRGVARMGAVPVVAACSAGDEEAVEVPLARAAGWLARTMDAPIVCLVESDGAGPPENPDSVRDPALVAALDGMGLSVRFSTVSGLASLK